MEEIVLDALERPMQPGRFKETGFVPGVLYGDSVSRTTPVKFNDIALRRLISRHGSHAKVWVKYGNNKKFGFVREVQKNMITGEIIHIDVQLVSKDKEIKMQLPIAYKGEDNLKHRELQLQVYKSEIDVVGKMALMPNAVFVDVSEKELGDTITAKDFNLDEQIKVNDKQDEIYSSIIHVKHQPDEEPPAVEAAKDSAEKATEHDTDIANKVLH